MKVQTLRGQTLKGQMRGQTWLKIKSFITGSVWVCKAVL